MDNELFKTFATDTILSFLKTESRGGVFLTCREYGSRSDNLTITTERRNLQFLRSVLELLLPNLAMEDSSLLVEDRVLFLCEDRRVASLSDENTLEVDLALLSEIYLENLLENY